MGLTEIIDKHPLITLIISAVTAGGVVFAIVNFYRVEEIKRIKSEFESVNKQLEAELSKIGRDLDNKEQLNLFDIFSDEVVRLGQIDCGTYIPDLNLCGPKLEPDWKYSVITEMELLKETVGLDSNNLTSEFEEAVTEGKVHLIRHEKYQTVEDPTDENPYKKLFTYLHIRSFPLSHMPKRFILNPIPKKMLEQAGVDPSETNSALNRFFKNDPMIAVMTSHLWDVYTTTLGKNSVSATVVDMRKFRRGFKFASVLVFKDHIIDGISTPKYFVMVETFALTRPQDIILVSTFVPMKSPSGQDSLYNTINGWILRMRLLS